MKLRTIIVDDEPLARDGIKLRLSQDNDFFVIGEYGNGYDAVNSINSHFPDLVFIDIQMPKISGFDVIKKIEINPFPFIVFVTAYDKYALQAFEVHALDYLLKPINDDRFNNTLIRLKEEFRKKTFNIFEQRIRSLITDCSTQWNPASNSSATIENNIERIAVKSKTSYTLVNVDEIEWIEAAGDYVYIHCENKKHLHRETMNSFEEILSPDKFQRIHRSAIVNVNRVKEIQPTLHGDFYVLMSGGSKVKLSRNYKEKFLSALKINPQ